jgi:hypothetical protein
LVKVTIYLYQINVIKMRIGVILEKVIAVPISMDQIELIANLEV